MLRPPPTTTLAQIALVAVASASTACAQPVRTTISPGESAVVAWEKQESLASRYTHDTTGLAEAARRGGQEFCAARGRVAVVDREEAGTEGGGEHVGICAHGTYVAQGDPYAVHRVRFRCAFADDVERVPPRTPACSGKLATLLTGAGGPPTATWERLRKRWADRFSGPVVHGVLGGNTRVMLSLWDAPRVGPRAVGPWKDARFSARSDEESWEFEALSGSFVVERVDGGLKGRLENVVLFGMPSRQPALGCTVTLTALEVDVSEGPPSGEHP